MRFRCLFVLLALSALGLAQKPPVMATDGKQSGLSAARLSILKKAGMRNLVPTWVPPGFKVAKFEFVRANEDEEAYWMAQFRNVRTKAEFTVQMASDGFGDPILSDDDGNVVDSNLGPAYKSPIFGTGRLYVAKKGSWSAFASDWIDLKVKSRPTHVMIYGQRIEPQLGKKVLESLRWLK